MIQQINPDHKNTLTKIKVFLEAQNELRRRRESGARLISAIIEYSGNDYDPLISSIRSERVEIDKSLLELDSKIKEIQSTCDHEFRYDGHDGHYSYHVCGICCAIDKL